MLRHSICIDVFFAWIWLQQCNLVKRFTAKITAETNCGNYRISLPLAKIPSNRFFTNFKLTWRKRICMAVNFTFTLCGKLLFHFCNNFVKLTLSITKLRENTLKGQKVLSRIYFCERKFRAFSHCEVWKFTITQKMFRETNSLVTFLSKPLLSRNFCRKWHKFYNFHIVLFIIRVFQNFFLSF